jgi:hypothetical protein
MERLPVCRFDGFGNLPEDAGYWVLEFFLDEPAGWLDRARTDRRNVTPGNLVSNPVRSGCYHALRKAGDLFSEHPIHPVRFGFAPLVIACSAGQNSS